MSGAGVWDVLGIAETGDQTAIRRAYARALKAIDPETDPAAFRTLREARDRAMYAAQTGEAIEEPEGTVLDAPPAAEPPAPAPPLAPPPVEADLAALHQLHAMVLDPASTATAAEIEEQTRRILADPAMINLDHAAAVENFLADVITRGTPRSDPVIEPAIAHFRWNASETELGRPPILRWILQRAEDRYFEIGLPGDSRFYAKLLARLRAAPPARFGWLAAWRFALPMEFLLSYLHQFHPTVLASVPQESLDWWSAAIERQKTLVPPLSWWRNAERRGVWANGLNDPRRDVLPLLPFLFLAPAVAPLLFLRRGYRPWLRVVGGVVAVGWLVVLIVAVVMPPEDRAGNAVGGSGSPRRTVAAVPVDEIDALLAATFDGALDGARAKAVNPAFYAALEASLREAKAHPEDDVGSRFEVSAARVMDRTLAAALRQGDRDLVLDHARAYESRLRWAERDSPERCVDTLNGAAGQLPPDFVAYHRKLVLRAIESGAPPTAGVPRSQRKFTIPPAIFADAAKRSGLPPAQFRDAAVNRGPALAQCNAAIALFDAAILAPDKGGLGVLKGLFGG